MAGELIAADWLEARLADGPAALSARTREFIAAAAPVEPFPERLVEAGRAALARAIAAPADRRSALDLLAADALVTLALAAQAELDPARLAAFARSIRRSEETEA